MQRREILSKTAVALATTSALAGCAGGESDRESGDSSGDSGGNDTTEEEQEEFSILEHEPFQTEYGNAGVEGVGKNNSDDTLSYVQVNVYFYDSSDTRLGEGIANVTDLQPGREWKFEAMYLGSDAEAIDSYEIQAEWTP